MASTIYWLMLAALFTHEMDAVKRHEWRILPITSFLSDQVGEQVFIWIHIPLFFTIMWFSVESVANTLPIAVSIFSIVHVALHWMLRNHPAYEFNNASSWSLILATGALGSLHLAYLALFAA